MGTEILLELCRRQTGRTAGDVRTNRADRTEASPVKKPKDSKGSSKRSVSSLSPDLAEKGPWAPAGAAAAAGPQPPAAPARLHWARQKVPVGEETARRAVAEGTSRRELDGRPKVAMMAGEDEVKLMAKQSATGTVAQGAPSHGEDQDALDEPDDELEEFDEIGGDDGVVDYEVAQWDEDWDAAGWDDEDVHDDFCRRLQQEFEAFKQSQPKMAAAKGPQTQPKTDNNA